MKLRRKPAELMAPMTAKRAERLTLVHRANKGIPRERHLNARQWQRAIFRLRQRGEQI